MGESRNRVGGVYALTMFAPILPGHEDELRAYLDALPIGADSPLARLDSCTSRASTSSTSSSHQGPQARRATR